MADTQAALETAQDRFRRATPDAKCSSIKDAAKFCGEGMALITNADSTSCDGSVCQPGLGGDTDTCCVKGRFRCPSAFPIIIISIWRAHSQSALCVWRRVESGRAYPSCLIVSALDSFLCAPLAPRPPKITAVKEEQEELAIVEGMAKTKKPKQTDQGGGSSMMVRPAVHACQPTHR